MNNLRNTCLCGGIMHLPYDDVQRAGQGVGEDHGGLQSKRGLQGLSGTSHLPRRCDLDVFEGLKL